MNDIQDERDPVDVFVGARMRALRRLRGLSQQALAQRLGEILLGNAQSLSSGAHQSTDMHVDRIWCVHVERVHRTTLSSLA